jgi:hypothetical protein
MAVGGESGCQKLTDGEGGCKRLVGENREREMMEIKHREHTPPPPPPPTPRLSRAEVRWLPAGVPLALEYPHIGHAERGVA